jgi:hypothetical protein
MIGATRPVGYVAGRGRGDGMEVASGWDSRMATGENRYVRGRQAKFASNRAPMRAAGRRLSNRMGSSRAGLHRMRFGRPVGEKGVRQCLHSIWQNSNHARIVAGRRVALGSQPGIVHRPGAALRSGGEYALLRCAPSRGTQQAIAIRTQVRDLLHKGMESQRCGRHTYKG